MLNLKKNSSLIIQTFVPEERIWQAVGSDTLQKFFATLIEERSLLGYPPATAMIRVTPLKQRMLQKSDVALVRDRLATFLLDQTEITVSPVYIRPGQKKGSSPAFLIKLPAHSPLPTPLITWLKRESHHLSLDVHPFHL